MSVCGGGGRKGEEGTTENHPLRPYFDAVVYQAENSINLQSKLTSGNDEYGSKDLL